jgi:competence protein ComEA
MKSFIKAGAFLGLLVAFAAHAGPVNINTADAKTLAKELNGVGAVKAEAIVQDREANWPFKSGADIMRVDGIGQAIYEQNQDNIKIKD